MASPHCSAPVPDKTTAVSSLTFKDALAQAKSQMNIPHELKDRQIEVLEHLFTGKDVVALLPTGYGKSLIYQISPFLLKYRTEWSGKNPICIVITPLNAIMREQIIKLAAMGIPACGIDVTGAGAVTSAEIDEHIQPEEEEEEEEEDNCKACGPKDSPTGKFFITNASMTDVTDGKFNIVFAHPEALLSSEHGQSLMRSEVYQDNVVCIALDEGHLVEKWGKKFRGDFLRIKEIVTLFDSVPHLVLTATASPKAVTEMVQKLQLDDPVIISTSPDRPNIRYSTRPRSSNNYDGLEEVLEPLTKELIEQGDAFPLTILYTDKDSIQFCYRFFKHSIPDAVGYSGDMTPENRRYAQYHLPYDEEMKLHIIKELTKDAPVIRIVFATIALGMGLDAQHIRRVIHFKAPTTIEQYMQETGRAGRDGLPADAILYYNGRDLKNNREDLTDQMVEYCHSTDECLRGLLLANFGHNQTNPTRGPTCCSICAKNAASSSE